MGPPIVHPRSPRPEEPTAARWKQRLAGDQRDAYWPKAGHTCMLYIYRRNKYFYTFSKDLQFVTSEGLETYANLKKHIWKHYYFFLINAVSLVKLKIFRINLIVLSVKAINQRGSIVGLDWANYINKMTVLTLEQPLKWMRTFMSTGKSTRWVYEQHAGRGARYRRVQEQIWSEIIHQRKSTWRLEAVSGWIDNPRHRDAFKRSPLHPWRRQIRSAFPRLQGARIIGRKSGGGIQSTANHVRQITPLFNHFDIDTKNYIYITNNAISPESNVFNDTYCTN